MADDYSAAIGGGLKLKGGKPSGVTKKKKKPKPSKEGEDSKASALQKALADEERTAEEEREAQAGNEEEGHEEAGGSGGGKTEAERKYEEMRRKRVCLYLFSPIASPQSPILPLPANTLLPSHSFHRHKKQQLINGMIAKLDERLRKEGVKTHKQRVEELNKYLSNLSEHHDMYVLIFPLIFTIHTLPIVHSAPPASVPGLFLLPFFHRKSGEGYKRLMSVLEIGQGLDLDNIAYIRTITVIIATIM